MATWSVRQSGGDFSTLASALADPSVGDGDIINIEGLWTQPDSSSASTVDPNLTIQCDAASKHPGYYDPSQNHYRLETTDGNHSLTIDNPNVAVIGLAIKMNQSGSSDECIRAYGTGTVIRSCVITHSDPLADDQDGIFVFIGSEVTIENTVIHQSGRCGIHIQSSSSGAATAHINSCTIFDCAGNADNTSGGISIDSGGNNTMTANVFNTVCVGNRKGSAEDFNVRRTTGTIVWDVHNSIDSDNSIADVHPGNVGCLANRTPTDNATPGPGDWVIFEDIQSANYDLRLQDNTTDNDAQDMHADTSGAGLVMPSNDIVNTPRPQNTDYDCGAFEVIPSVAGPKTGTGALQAGDGFVLGIGSAFAVSTGTGDLVSDDAAVAGAGERVSVHTGPGNLVSEDGMVGGAGIVPAKVRSGTGALQADDGAVSGVGGGVSGGPGTLLSQDAAVSGVGSAFLLVDGTAAFVAEGGGVSGVGVVGEDLLGDGALVSQDAAVSGDGIVIRIGAGDLVAGDAAIFGEGSVIGIASGSGDLQAGQAFVSGIGGILRTGDGALQAGAASVAGAGFNIKPSDTTLTTQDLANIQEAVWAKLVNEGLVAKVEELWQRRGLDPANPHRQSKSEGIIEVGGITIDVVGDANEVTQTRRP